MKKIYALYFIILIFTSEAYSQSQLPTFSYKPKLTIYTENWAPYQYTDPQGNIRGSSVDKVTKILDAANWPYEIVVLPWARAIFQIHVVPNSLIFSIARFPERENKYHWIGLLDTIKSKIVASAKNKDIKINQLSDITKYVLVLKRGEASSLYFLENNLINENKVIWVTSSKQTLHLLNIGRGDLYPDSETAFKSAVENSPYNLSQFKYVYDFKELNVNLYIAASSSTDPKLIKDLSLLFNNQSFTE